MNRDIEADEGYRPKEPIGPFYAESLPCESCGHPTEGRTPASWNSRLMVGPCCQFANAEFLPNEPVCEVLFQRLMRCASVSQVEQVYERHEVECPVCAKPRERAA